MTSINREDELHKIILLTAYYISQKLGGNSVYYFFAEELRDIQRKYLHSFNFEDIMESLMIDSTENIKSALNELSVDIFRVVSEFGRAVSQGTFMMALHFPLRPGAPQWLIVIREAYHFATNKIAPQYLEKFTKSIHKITSTKSNERNTDKIRKLNKTMYEIIYKISILLFDILVYILAQYEENGDPIERLEEISEKEQIRLAELENDDDDDDDDDEDEEVDEAEKAEHELKVILLANYHIGLIATFVIGALGFMVGYFLFNHLTLPDEEIISDNSILFLFTLAVYTHILLSSLYQNRDVYNALFMENRILVNNLINLLSVFIRIYETCGEWNLECIENALVDKIYADGRNSHYVAIGLSAYS